jgi:hypothetical protein
MLTDESPVLVDTSGQRNFLPDLCARRLRQLELGEIGFYTDDLAPARRGPNVDEQELSLCQLLHFGLFLVVRLDTKQPTQQEQVYFQLCGQF